MALRKQYKVSEALSITNFRNGKQTHIIDGGNKVVLVCSHRELGQNVLIGAFIHDSCIGSLAIPWLAFFFCVSEASYSNVLVVHVLEQEHE